MPENNQSNDLETVKRPRRADKPAREVKEIYRLDQENEISEPEFLVSIPNHVNERRFIKQTFGAGLYFVWEKQGGRFGNRYEVLIEDSALTNEKQTLEVAPEFNDEDDLGAPEFDLSAEIETRAEIISLRRELREIKNLERERNETAQTSQNETLSMMREMQKQSEKSFQQGREQGLEMMKMFMQLQPQQSKENPTEVMLSMLKGTLEVQRGVRELSDEISPDAGGESSIIGDAAKLVHELGKNASTFIPLLFNRTASVPTARPGPAQRRAKPKSASNQTPNGNGQGELTDLLNKVKNKKEEKSNG